MAAQPSVATNPKVQWTLDWVEPFCSVSTGSPKSLGLAIWTVPGSDVADVYLIGTSPELASIKSPTVDLTLMPQGARFQPAVERNGGRAVIKLTRLDREFVTAFGRANQIQIATPKGPLIVRVPGADKARAALDGCIDETLVEWGVDPVAQRSLQCLPKHVDGGWLHPRDFPEAAIDAGKDGYVVARLNVDATGKVTDCAVVVSLGLKSFGTATCKAAMERARFSPALGPDGQPAAALLIERVKYRLF